MSQQLSTLEFLRLIVPQEGDKFISKLGKNERWSDIWAGETHEEMAALIKQYSREGRNIYHANATFLDSESRKADNGYLLKAFFMDLDAGKGTADSYDTQADALAALKEFDFIKPTLVVSSGNGIHVYWVLEEAVSVKNWKVVAERLKAYGMSQSLIQDRNVTADIARVLRPVGTTWYPVDADDNREPQPVTTIEYNPETLYTLESFSQSIPKSIGASEQKMEPRPKADNSAPITMNQALSSGIEYPPVDPELMIARCGQIRKFSESGAMSYNMWRLNIGVMVYAQNGRELIHEWSAKGYDAYDRDETDRKIDTWNSTGATRCETFRNEDANNPDSPCKTCAWRCNSPWSLGHGEGIKEREFKTPEGKTEKFLPTVWPENARITPEDKLEVLISINIGTVRAPEWVDRWTVATNIPFYFETIVRDLEGYLQSDMIFFYREGEMRKAPIKHDIILDGSALKKELSGRGIHIHNQKATEAFIMSYLDALKKEVGDTKTFAQMGWLPDFSGIVIGDQLVTADSIEPVRADKNLATKKGLLNTTKSAKHWAGVVDRLYYVPGGLPYQFSICALMGSVLVPILNAEEFNGIPLALTSDSSGYGKSTVSKIALAAWGNVERGVNVLTGDDVSVGAVEVNASTMNCIPYTLDEWTNKPAHDTSHVLYMLSNGISRARLKQDGTPRPMSPPWKGIASITGNANVFLKLTQGKVNPEAAQLRVFEIPLENYPRLQSLDSAAELTEITNSVRSGYGDVGVMFVRFIMEHKEEIEETLWSIVKEIGKRAGVRADKERFYIYFIACAIVSGKILRKLGLIRFNMDAVFDWAIKHMSTLRDSTAEYQRSTEEELGMMLASFVGEGRFIATQFMPGPGEGTSRSIYPLRGIPCGRVVMDSQIVVVTVEGLAGYCVKEAKNLFKFKSDLIEAGIIHPSCISYENGTPTLTPIDFSLSTGIPSMPLGTMKCYRLNYEKAIGQIGCIEFSDMTNVTEFRDRG